MTDDQTAADGFAMERWIYTGIRVTRAGKRAHAWLDAGGKTLLYTDSGRFVIGGLYEVPAKRPPSGITTRKTPVYTGMRSDDAEALAVWEALDTAAGIELARARLHTTDAKRTELDEALAPLLVIARRMRTGAERDALAATIIRRVADQAWN